MSEANINIMTELNARIPTVDEYLQLVDCIDWKFEPHVEKGMNDDFYWLRSKHLGIANPWRSLAQRRLFSLTDFLR